MPAILEGSGHKARDRIEQYLRAAIDSDNTRRAYGRGEATLNSERLTNSDGLDGTSLVE